MEELIELTVEQLAKALDVSKDAAGFLLLALSIFLLAWTVSWLFLPWTIYSKLNNISEKLGSISGKLANLSEKLHQVRDDVQGGMEGIKRLNEKVQDIHVEINQLSHDFSEGRAEGRIISEQAK